MTTNRIVRPRNRRGVLLLLVLTALTFFMLLGAFLLVMAIRARAASRAFADATQAAAVKGAQARALLDEALLIALRGSKDPAVKARITESILGDKYGLGTESGTFTLSYSGSVPLLQATIAGTAAPRAMFGRVLTLSSTSPALNQERGLPVSFRIVGANSGTAFLANAPARPEVRLPATSTTYRGVINGREFMLTGTTGTTGTTAAEPWDAFDDSNPWLAQPVVDEGQVVSFRRGSFHSGAVPATGPDVVDNDNDGVADGVLLSGIFPDRPTPGGGTCRYRVSYLILDLDGRINVNTSGAVDGSGTAAIPRGMGYGPADLVPTGVVSADPHPLRSSNGDDDSEDCEVWTDGFLSEDPVVTATGSASREQRRPSPGVAVVGRYGRNGIPGRAGDDVSALQQTIATGSYGSYGRSLYALTVAGTNAIADLRGIAEVTMRAPTADDIMPTMRVSVGDSAGDGIDDPYEVRLDALAPRLTAAVSGTNSANDDNPFAAADMERILRANDADAAALPQRLAAALGGIAQQSRMRITTDNWDTPGLTGAAARQVHDFLTGGSVPALIYPWSGTNAIAPDVAAGLRFNLNRPVRVGTSATAVVEQQNYCKDVYTLLRALGFADARSAAQWSANVLDFRDDDSTMTRFVYDTNLADGWNPSTSGTGVGTGTVFGIERPDLVITETAGWWQAASGTGQLFVTLHRPSWRAEFKPAGPLEQREQLAPELGSSNLLDLATANRAWQLRFDTNKVVQFHALAGGTAQATQHVLQSGTVTSGTVTVFGSATAADAIGPGEHLCVHAANRQNFTVSVTRHEIGAGFAPTSAGPKTIWLERLADPARVNAADNPYVVVDTAPMEVIDVPAPPAPPPPFTKRRRPGPSDPSGALRGLAAFWRSAGAWETDAPEMKKYQAAATNPVAWLHWPNRPFVSHAELVLVPSDAADGFLQAYRAPTSSLVSDTTGIVVNGTTVPFGRLLLDAVHVPSRFAGTSFTLSGTHAALVSACGLDRVQAAHLSAWREPGRVNVNTIVSGSTAATSTSDAAVWSTLISGTELRLVDGSTTRTVSVNPFQSGTGASPATSTSQLLSLSTVSGSSAPPMAAEAFTSGGPLHPRDKNPFLAYATAIRLANTATIRSNVFAVWITLETVETADNGNETTTYQRLFAIVDRSIPVGFQEGENLNVRDTIRLRRFLD
jgi:hypothetical protein